MNSAASGVPATQSATAHAYRSTVYDHSADAIWAAIRDFNSYPDYIEGVTESYLEDDKAGDEVGCVRRFVYNGTTIRQRLVGHSDAERWFTHTGCEPLRWPWEGQQAGPIDYYLNRVQITPVTDTGQAFVAWSVEHRCAHPDDLKRWKTFFDESIPEWLASLRRYMARQDA